MTAGLSLGYAAGHKDRVADVELPAEDYGWSQRRDGFINVIILGTKTDCTIYADDAKKAKVKTVKIGEHRHEKKVAFQL